MAAAGLDTAGEDPVYADEQLAVTWAREQRGLKLTGEIDASNAGAVAGVLAAHALDAELHLDLSGLHFCDVGGVRALVDLAGTHRLLLHGMRAQAERLLDMAGWSELPGVAFCACELQA